MKINILQKNGDFNGLEFFPEKDFEFLQLYQITKQLKNLNKIVVKYRKIKEINEESLIIKMIR